jgi:hypothetical protein
MRIFALLAVLLLGACSSLAPTAIDATRFRNTQTGEIAAGCGRMQGFAGPLHEAQQGCIDVWKSQGWTPLPG